MLRSIYLDKAVISADVQLLLTLQWLMATFASLLITNARWPHPWFRDGQRSHRWTEPLAGYGLSIWISRTFWRLHGYSSQADKHSIQQQRENYSKITSCHPLKMLTESLVFSERDTYVHVRYMLSAVRLSSVTLVHPTQAVELIGNFFSPYDSPGTLLFWCQQSLVGDAHFPLKFAFKVTNPLSNSEISTNIGS